MTETKGAFGKCKTKITHGISEGRKFIIVLRRIACFRCGRRSKFNKKNFPMPVVVNKKRIGYLCKVCIKKAYILKEKKRLEKLAKEKK